MYTTCIRKYSRFCFLFLFCWIEKCWNMSSISFICFLVLQSKLVMDHTSTKTLDSFWFVVIRSSCARIGLLEVNEVVWLKVFGSIFRVSQTCFHDEIILNNQQNSSCGIFSTTTRIVHLYFELVLRNRSNNLMKV